MTKNILGVSLCEISGPLNDFMEKLSGEDGKKWLAAFKRFLRKENPWNVINYIYQTFLVWVDETQTMEKIVASGKFGWTEGVTNKLFPELKGGKKMKKEIFLFHFHKTMTTEAVIIEMNASGCKPCSVWDLIGLLVIKPEIPKEMRIVALGSGNQSGGYSISAQLNESSNVYDLFTGSLSCNWGGHCRFIGVRK